MDLSPYLLFDIAHSHYAINAKVVEEVFFLPELTTMAEAPRDIVGMFNLRGTIVPVFDLPHCLGHRRQRYQLSDSLITIHDGELKVTFLVNQVREVVQIDPESITRKFIYQPQEGGSPSPDVAWGDSPSLPLRQRQRFLKGVVQIQTHLVSLLDEEAILQALRQQVPEDDEFIEESEERSQQQEPERDRVEFCPDASLEEQDVFRQRANRLRTPTETPDLNQIISLAVVALQGEYFGIDLQVVREFTDVRYITPIPCCPPHVVGNMNLRGEILTLIRINQCLNLEPTLSEGDRHPEQRRRAVVVQVDKMVVGILVDEVFDVTPINPRNISPMPTAIRATSDEYLQGTVLYEATALTILDIRKLLTQGELVVDEEP
ncbi:chemotaxis protein CheW [Phormidium yuhuli AB48]|uniref:Chemotaxis protein CheW n=1 Tax=Phormidium yuhuli AB48 TaxID=2940671 RepID=A0ABY5ANE4_9CYAN|nr:chemotaxis protein CheW [Phormidium yuhuli]USR90707.1 chemotaxis protein CheW [Phormidium yuhuli AB48]